ncbi:MAG: hypothetical protein RLZZ179_592 [Verrucomicrobiota bacterium]|jgi:hypothetical protein
MQMMIETTGNAVAVLPRFNGHIGWEIHAAK